VDNTLKRPFFWKVRNRPVHFLGSLHFGPPGGFILPSSVLSVVKEASTITFEIPFDGPLDPSPLFRNSGSLEDDLSPLHWSILTKMLANTENLNRYRLEALFLLLAPLPYQARGLIGKGLDPMLFDWARANSKRILTLETRQEQIAIILKECGDEISKHLARCIDAPSLPLTRVDQVLAAMTSGDEGELAALKETAFADLPRKAVHLFTERDVKWVPAFEAQCDSRDPALIIVGALHFAEPGGMLSLLRGRGYVIDRV